MVKTLDIKEARAIYGPDLPGPEEVAKGPVVIPVKVENLYFLA